MFCNSVTAQYVVLFVLVLISSHACTLPCNLQTARKIHVAKFRAKKVDVLVTTDVAARGIDIPLIDNVINYDFPPKPELFIHR